MSMTKRLLDPSSLLLYWAAACILYDEKLREKLHVSIKPKWKKKKNPLPSCLHSFFQAARLQSLPKKQLQSTFAGGGEGVAGEGGLIVSLQYLST